MSRASRRSQADHGFTLVELLVVIVILGILSGVVVFAVRGAGDKGRDNAVATDKRIVSTAMEAFCAQYGRYPRGTDGGMDELVNGPLASDNVTREGKGFLSQASTYNAQIDPPAGECGGNGSESGGEPEKCVRLNAAGAEETVATESGMWCLAASPIPLSTYPAYKNKGLVQLRNGKVLAIREFVSDLPAEQVLGVDTYDGYLTQLFDPADGPKGSWSDGPVARVRPEDGDRPFSNLALIDGPTDKCGDRCGHVFAHFGGHRKLYDPEANTWSAIEPNSTVAGFNGHGAVLQLTGEGCAQNCFKILTVNRDSPDAWAELYDPFTNEFEPLFKWTTEEGAFQPTVAELADGRVIVRVTWLGQGNPQAYILDVSGDGVGCKDGNECPRSESIDRGRTGNYLDPPAVLHDGRLLYMYPTLNGGEMYIPEEGGPGIWTPLPPQGAGIGVGISYTTCATVLYCVVYGTLLDGRILGTTDGGVTRLLDSRSPAPFNGWSDTRFQPNRSGYGYGVPIDPSRGPCGMNCNKMLLVGANGAQMYTP
ncbi:MAG: prepilin-type N-terminal cleavage/methylation domain-containing protein [Acidimicrobiales bacterium]